MEFNKRMADIKLSIREITKLASLTPDCIRFDIGQPDFDTPQHIKDGAIKAINEGFTGYTSSFGIPDLRKAIAEKEREKGLKIDEKNVLVTTGGIGALSCCILGILEPGDEVISPNPFWSPYTFIVANAHGKLVETKFFENGKFKRENIERNISEKTKAIIVNTPENPTGRVIRKEDLETIADIATENDLFLVSDEVYEKITFGDAKHFAIASMAPERTFLVNSCSKTYAMPGWRVGWVIGEERFIEEMMKINRALTACPNSIAQRAALTALTGPQECVEEMRKEYEKRRNYAVKKLTEMGIDFLEPKGTFYVFPEVKQDSWKFSLGLLKEKKVSVVPGDAFGSAGRSRVRMSLTLTVDKIKEGLERIQRYLNK